MCIYKNHNSDEQYWNRMQHLEPCPRFAYQLVYDQKNKVYDSAINIIFLTVFFPSLELTKIIFLYYI